MTSEKRRKLLLAVREEHAAMDAVVAGVAARLRALDAGLPSAEGGAQLVAELERLRTRLERHFRAEENLDLHGTLLELVPAAEAEIERLAADHAAVRRLLGREQEAPANLRAGRLSELRKAAALLLEVLAAHETSENELIERALRVGDDPQ